VNERCDYVMPNIGVLKEFSLNTRRCALSPKHEGEHQFDIPRIVGKKTYAADPKPVSKKKGKRK